jgi:rod shape-determining protein MreC
MNRWQLAILASILGIIGYFRVGATTIDYLVACLAYPGIRVITWATDTAARWYHYHQSVRELVASLEQSQAKIAHLSAEVIALRGTRIQLDEVREVRRFRRRYATDWLVCAQVVTRTISADAHIYILDKGERHGVKRDMVAVYQNCLIGRVSDVYPWWCKVTLVTDRLSKVPVVCAETKTEAIFEGMNDVSLGSLSYVSHLEPLKRGEMVVTSGQGFVYPKGFALGHVHEIRREADKLQYHVTVEPILNMQQVKVCFLLAKGSEYGEDNSLSDHDEKTCTVHEAYHEHTVE